MTSDIVYAREGISASLTAVGQDISYGKAPSIPDIISQIQAATELTRATIAKILVKSNRLGDAFTNPQLFIDTAISAIRHQLYRIMINGVKYERVAGSFYEMRLFEQNELRAYVEDVIKVKKSLHKYVVFESQPEKDFAQALDQRNDIRLFIKLPSWFKVETPIGTYNPDWAIVKEGEEKLYLVRETKSTLNPYKLREGERDRILCGTAHFKELGLEYKSVKDASEV